MTIKLTSLVPLDKQSKDWLNKAEKHLNEEVDKCFLDLATYGYSFTLSGNHIPLPDIKLHGGDA